MKKNIKILGLAFALAACLASLIITFYIAFHDRIILYETNPIILFLEAIALMIGTGVLMCIIIEEAKVNV